MTGMSRPVAVVTGAGRGIGRYVAVRLAKAGFDLVVGDAPSPDAIDGLGYTLARPESLERSATQCAAEGVEVVAMPCDVRDPDAVAELVAAAPRPPRVAVAVAGIIGSDGLAWELTPADYERDMAVNLYGVVHLAAAAVPHLLRAPKGKGRFVAVVSSAAVGGLPRLAPYVASKHAALGYIRALAADLGPYGVTANAVLPGSTRTRLLERTAQVYGLDDVEEFAHHQRINRLIEPDEIAAAVEWLCHPAASAVTGAAFGVDGGFVG